VGTGDVTFDDLMGHLEELAADPRYQPPMLKLVDYRNSRMVPLDDREFGLFSARKTQSEAAFQGERCAVVSVHDLDFGMSRMLGARIDTEKVETGSFRNIADALAWLGVEIDEDDLKNG